MPDERKKIGELAAELKQADSEIIHDRGTEEDAYHDFMPQVWETIKKSTRTVPDKDIFVEVYLEMRPTLKTRIRHFRSRTTCPNPQFNQVVFQYKHATEQLILLWSLPQEWQCQEIKEYALNIDPEYKELRDFVIDFYDGALEKKVKEINKDAILKQNIVLTLDTDSTIENKLKLKEKIKEKNDQRKRVTLY